MKVWLHVDGDGMIAIFATKQLAERSLRKEQRETEAWFRKRYPENHNSERWARDNSGSVEEHEVLDSVDDPNEPKLEDVVE